MMQRELSPTEARSRLNLTTRSCDGVLGNPQNSPRSLKTSPGSNEPSSGESPKLAQVVKNLTRINKQNSWETRKLALVFKNRGRINKTEIWGIP